jgi:hypothetical protein
MIGSMRAFGYSLPAAIADLVDNSVAADSNLIQIRFTGTNLTLAAQRLAGA